MLVKNQTKRQIVFNLPHAQACSATECTCSRMKIGVQEHDANTGERIVRAVNQRVAASITLFPKGMRGPGGERMDEARVLPNAIRVKEIQEAAARGEITLERTASDSEPDAPKEIPPSEDPVAEMLAVEPSPADFSTSVKTSKKNATAKE